VLPRTQVFVRVPTHGVEAALQRAVAGIWDAGEGRIVRPSLERVLLIPERPYLPPGTLRELLVGSDAAARASDDELRELLHGLGAERALRRVGGLDAERDWDDILSLEEQRLMEIARVLLTAPPFAVVAGMDEGLGRERAERVLATLTERGVGLLEISQVWRNRPGAHVAWMEIAADGAWQHIAQQETG
jgi:putative ATP-binding cassette transporter